MKDMELTLDAGESMVIHTDDGPTFHVWNKGEGEISVSEMGERSDVWQIDTGTTSVGISWLASGGKALDQASGYAHALRRASEESSEFMAICAAAGISREQVDSGASIPDLIAAKIAGTR